MPWRPESRQCMRGDVPRMAPQPARLAALLSPPILCRLTLNSLHSSPAVIFPTIMMQGLKLCPAVFPTILPRVPRQVLWLGSAASRTTATGVSGRRPCSISRPTISANLLPPISSTSVSSACAGEGGGGGGF